MAYNNIKIGVLAVQGAVAEHLVHLNRINVSATTVKSGADLESVKGLIIPGGESTTIGKLIETFELAEPIRKRNREGSLALFGTCAGMILLAKKIEDGKDKQPLLGLLDITLRRNAFGRQRESFEADIIFNDFEVPHRGIFIRAPLIEYVGPGITVLAKIEEGIIAVKKDLLLGTSFHPELTDDSRIHQYFAAMCEAV